MTGNPYFGMRFYGTSGLVLGQVTMNLSGGLGIRFERDAAANTNVRMGTSTQERLKGIDSNADLLKEQSQSRGPVVMQWRPGTSMA